MSRSTQTSLARLRSMTLAAVACLLAQLAWGAVTGRISGTVKDPTGAVVPSAQITVLETSTGIKTETKTDVAGFYSFPSLPVGHYDLTVRASGFKDYKQTGLILDVNTALLVDVPLQLGEASQQVTVTSAAVQVETTNTQMGEVITDSKMTMVPLNGRSYTDLLALQPGVAPVSSGQYGALNVSGNLNPGSLSVNGQRESANGFMVNGGNVEEGTYMGTSIIPNLDSIAEFRIITNNFDAEYGNYSGGQINAITKSGTNGFHGDAFDFLRNTDLDARNFYSPGIGKYIQNQFGATAGGRIIRDKLFFFVDYQGTRQIQGQSTGLIPVPSAADRQGNLSDIASKLTGNVTGQSWANQLSQKLGYTVNPGEAYYTPGCTLNTSCVFPNAVIPQSVITTPSQNLIKYIPVANSGSNYSTSAFNQTLHDDKGSYRLDYNTRFGMISGYYFLDDFNQIQPYASSNYSLPGFATTSKGRAQMANIADTKTFGPTAVNEVRLHYMRMVNLGGFPSGGLGVTLDSLGFVTGPSTLGLVVQNKANEGVPSVGFNSFGIGVPAYFAGQYNNTYQLLDNFSKVSGTHTMKFGADVHYDQITEHDYGANNGTFGFNGQETGSDWADFLLGAPNSFQQGVQAPLHTRAYYYGLYAQDSWRAKPSLTVNYGVRWEVTSPWYEAQGQLETLVPGLQSKVFPGSPTGWVFPGDPGIPKSLAPVRHNNFGPRVGLAWSPTGKIFGGPGKTSIRASFGIFYTAFENATGFNEVGDAPFGYFWSQPAPPLFVTPYIDRETGFVEGQRFPVNFPPSNVSASHPDNSVNWANFEPISSSPGLWYKNRVPYAEHYSFSIQRQIGSASVLSVSYVGTQGHSLLSDLESNPGNPALCLSLMSNLAPNSAVCGPNSENAIFTRANGQVVNGTRGPYGNAFGSNGYFMTIGNSNYNSLQVTFRHRSGPLEVLAGYTWSKSIDDASGWGEQINLVNQRLGRAISSFDVPHNFGFSYHYDLPFDRIARNRLTSGWVITGITHFATGLPVTMFENDDHSLLGTNGTGPNGNGVDTPNFGGGRLTFHHDARSGLPYFDPNAFWPEGALCAGCPITNLGVLGTANRRMFHGPGFNNWDLALLKDTHITEATILQFRLEFFNVFNHTQFQSPPGDILNGNFGLVTSANSPRIGQVALKLLF
ncbi:MAG TPA: carboxypeptidase regulatory-like domain-containing protein [Terriglobales bacterium]|nr:carboxypeptidase regulatory-like domain-containing protein [Terriglobales bacterium]